MPKFNFFVDKKDPVACWDLDNYQTIKINLTPPVDLFAIKYRTFACACPKDACTKYDTEYSIGLCYLPLNTWNNLTAKRAFFHSPIPIGICNSESKNKPWLEPQKNTRMLLDFPAEIIKNTDNALYADLISPAEKPSTVVDYDLTFQGGCRNSRYGETKPSYVDSSSQLRNMAFNFLLEKPQTRKIDNN